MLKARKQGIGAQNSQIIIRDDKTPKQLQYLQYLQTELEEKNSAGENFTIKYKNGIPTILPKNLPIIPKIMTQMLATI